MGSLPRTLRWSAVVLALLATASCSAAPGPTAPGSAASGSAASGSAASGSAVSGSAAPGSGSPPAPAGTSPLTAQISQFRDNYSKRIIEIQLTNTGGGAVTVLAAELKSPFFAGGISWTSAAAGTELPPGQTKSLPAQLPAASCPDRASPSDSAPQPGETAAQPAAVVEVRLASATGTAGNPVTVAAADPFGVLARNNAELCVAQAAAAVADLRLSPDLELAQGGGSAVLRLVITPRYPAGGAAGAGGELTINSIGGTTLLEEDPSAPWPGGVRVDAAGPGRELRLGIRPARCDPHAVAEDKVGTLLPLHVTVAGREGELKIDAGAQLRGRIYDFVTSACGHQ
ncbi:MAG: hypothetical protein NTU93_18460 [Arthrobacter sp.]|nr:hypothetical protein [Arthrobacter sp.]